jgi:hypothetical protein
LPGRCFQFREFLPGGRPNLDRRYRHIVDT